MEPEDGRLRELCIQKRPIVNGIDDAPGVGELHPRSHAVAAPGPASVDQPRRGPVLLHLLGEHGRVLGGMHHDEGGSEAGREGGCGLGDAVFGAGNDRSVPADEVVHGLRERQLTDRGQHAERVAGQENDILRMRPDAGDLRVGDELDGVRGPRVLGHGLVAVIDLAALLVEDHVLQDSPELDRVPNVGLALFREVDALGVAAPLDVGHAVGPPAVLVVADQQPVVVGGQRGFAGSRQAEEERHVASLAHVAAGVQRQNAALGHEVVHEAEEPLLHLARILGAQDHHLLALEVHVHAGRRRHVVRVPVAGELARVVDGEVRRPEVLELLGRGADAHVVHEERVVRPGRDDSHLDPVVLVPVQELIVHEDLLERVQIIHCPLPIHEERLLVHLDVGGALAPPEIVPRAFLRHDALVLGGSSGLGTRQRG
ncbi:hypothetical protein Mapa_012357 [Marchantia paleacea]|nr:hypothetical protein Mapa_012357 [Marchantia paleacea]